MKKLLLTLVVSMIMSVSFAKTVYCVMYLQFERYQGGYSVWVNTGTNDIGVKETAPGGHSLFVKSNVEALNLLSNKGWAYVDTYVDGSTRYYILKKEIPD